MYAKLPPGHIGGGSPATDCKGLAEDESFDHSQNLLSGESNDTRQILTSPSRLHFAVIIFFFFLQIQLNDPNIVLYNSNKKIKN